MFIRSGIIFCTLLLGSLAVPVPEQDEVDMSYFFENTFASQEGSRIVGGNVAAAGAHPWMAAFTIGGTFRLAHCGGSVISQRTVLTAAHCIVPVTAMLSSVRVTAGTNTRTSGGQSLSVNGFANHPGYDPNTIKNDIGVLYTTTNFAFNNLVQAIPVGFDFVGGGVPARVAGFGQTSAIGLPSNQLLEIAVPTITGQQCVNGVIQASIDLNIQAPPVDPNVEICTFLAVGRGTCRGDSGSALVRTDRGQQIGIVSWGFPCARGAPDMYARTSAYQSWINANLR